MTDYTVKQKVNVALSLLCLVLGAVLAFLVFVDRWTDVVLPLPRFWYQSRNFHTLSVLVLFFLSWWCDRQAGRVDEDSSVLFSTVRVYTKPNCELCDRAMDVLSEFSNLLPPVESVDISGNRELESQHGQHVPVVEIDGRVRFRGIVSEELLHRLVTAKQNQQRQQGSQA